MNPDVYSLECVPVRLNRAKPEASSRIGNQATLGNT